MHQSLGGTFSHSLDPKQGFYSTRPSHSTLCQKPVNLTRVTARSGRAGKTKKLYEIPKAYVEMFSFLSSAPIDCWWHTLVVSLNAQVT
jgi:hypothetical protein